MACRTAVSPRSRIGGMTPKDATRAAASGSSAWNFGHFCAGSNRRFVRSCGGTLARKHIGALGHRRSDVVRLCQQVEPSFGGLLEHHLGGRHRIHRLGLDVEHGLALGFRGRDVTGVDAARRLEDVGRHRTGQDGLHVDVIVAGVLRPPDCRHSVSARTACLLMMYGACRGTTATPPIEDRFHTHAGVAASIILGRNARTP